MTFSPDAAFESTGLVLPPAPAPLGLYKRCVTDGKMLYLSGHLPMRADGSLIMGRIGAELDMDAGKSAARQVALSMLATLKAELGSLDKVKRVFKLFGMVSAAPDFYHTPHVINGCCELLAQVWGADNGVGVRSAVGVASLPENVPVEIEAIFELV